MTDLVNGVINEPQDGLFDINSQDLLFHCGQVPPGESEEDLPLMTFNSLTRRTKKTKSKKKLKCVDKQRHRSSQSTSTFVLSNNICKGRRLIQIKITDIDNDDENVIVSAQYIVKNMYHDEVLDQTERIVKKICENITCIP